MVLWNIEAGIVERLKNKLVGIKIDLPVVVIMAVRTHCKHRAGEVKLQQFDVGCWIGEDVADAQKARFERLNGNEVIRGVRQLGRQINSSIRIRRKVLNVIGK